MICKGMDWKSTENHIFLNPRFSSEQTRELLDLLSPFSKDFQRHLFLLSSGTTSQSHQDLKWIALHQEAFLASASAVNRHLESQASDIWLHPLPDFHVGGMSIWARSYLSGAKVVKLGAWNATDFTHTVESQRATLTSLVPAQVFDLVQGSYKAPTCLRGILVGGGALAPELYQRAKELGWPLLPTYGMTETCSQVATAKLMDHHSMAAVARVSFPQLEILSHLDVKLNEGGLIQIKGDSLLSAVIYRDKDQQPIKIDPKIDGWFQTQDRGLLNGNGLQILGRAGDFVKIGGESVEVGRLRDILEKVRIHLGIRADVAVLPVPDERLGHVIHCVAESQLPESEVLRLAESFNSQVLAFEKIRKWHHLPVLPRTPLGKLIYSACLERISLSPPQ